MLLDTAYLLVSATTILLRCAVESSTTNEQRNCSKKLSGLLEHLQLAYRETHWDLAQLCIETCAQSIKSLEAAHQDLARTASLTLEHNAMGLSVAGTSEPGVVTDTNDSAPSYSHSSFQLDLDIPWDYLWDDIGEPWPLLE